MDYKEINGLSSHEVKLRTKQFGPNELPEARPPGMISLFIRQFKSPFIYVLLIAALVSVLLGQHINSIFILLVLTLNATIGTFQEYAAEKAASGLSKLVPHKAVVIRDNKKYQIDTTELVPGDIVLLCSGDKVPADIHLLDSQQLLVDESMLTGESKACIKDSNFCSNKQMLLSEKQDMAYAGTTVLKGRAIGKVVGTGGKTEIGKIAEDVISDNFSNPPLMQRIDFFTKKISLAMLCFIVIIFFITFFQGKDLYTVFLLGVALAVSAIPEGLPVAITVALAIGMQRMAKSGVIVRKLIAIESLGSCTYIASDKTGTLTVNQMTVRKIILPDQSEFSVTGEGMDVSGQIVCKKGSQKGLSLLLACGIFANEAQLDCFEEQWHHSGDTVDLAFLVLAEKAGMNNSEMRAEHPALLSIPYESENAFAASLHNYQGKPHLFIKGSFESLMMFCHFKPGTSEQERLKEHALSLASQGYRVLALGYKVLKKTPENLDSELNNLIFLGIVGIIDPCRPEAIKAIKQCRNAQIKVVMITGDHPETAAALSRELGISRQSVERKKDTPVTGKQLQEALKKGKKVFNILVNKARVFARVEPQQKKDIVDSLISQGEFIAMTGDGVNDAPALKHAHVGVSMGDRGTDVARESSDVILTDDNFSSIVEGVKQGRIVYNNIRKVIFLLISTGAAEIALIILSLLFSLPLPLLPIQLLWLNLVTNGIQDVALVFEPEEGDELQKPPRHPKEPVFDRLMTERVVINAIVMGGIAFAVFATLISSGMDTISARNLTLLQMVLFENVHVLNSRSETRSIFRHNLFSNPLLLFGMLASQGVHIVAMYTPWISTVLQISPVTLNQWTNLLMFALILIIVDECHKLLINRKSKKSVAV